MDLSKPQIIQLPKIQDPRGNLSFFENKQQIVGYITNKGVVLDLNLINQKSKNAYKWKNKEI